MLGLYLHLPFCRVHCTYCPFAISTDIELQDRYVAALLQEIRCGAGNPAGEAPPKAAPTVDTIYLGGGTPSRTSIANLRRIVAAIRERFDVAPDAEFSMEANPEDVDRGSLEAWRGLGVNRLSIGVQSFHDDELRAIGRIHDAATACEAIALAVSRGMSTNLDLILGLPRQTRESFSRTLDEAIALGAGHLSLYMLDLDETTPLQVQVARGRVEVPDDDLVASLYRDAIERLDRAGLAQYEISNFARAGEECRHNLRYWTRGEYHGFGLGAHSFIDERRFANSRNIHKYIDDWISGAASPEFSEDLGDGERRRETLFLGLRQTSGINYDQLVALFGQEAVEWVSRGLQDGWLRRDDARVAFTSSGFLLSNDYISQLF